MATPGSGGASPGVSMYIDLAQFEEGLAAKVTAATAAKAKWVRSGAQIIERQAKVNASSGRHKQGTPTPATVGRGPAIVTGTLRRSIRTQYEGTDTAKIGPTVIYGRRVELEYGYPYLIPAAEWAVKAALPILMRRIFGEAMKA